MIKKFKVVVTSKIHEDGIKLLKDEVEIDFPSKPLNLLTSNDLIEIGIDADALLVVTNVEKITRNVINDLPKLRIIARHGVGYDNVDIKAASERGVYVTITPVLNETVADQAFALVLCLARNICKADNFIKSKEWKIRDPFKFMGIDIWGKTAGIIGLGRIGTSIAERAIGFKMSVLYNDIIRKLETENRLGVEYTPLNTLLQKSDFVFITAPLNNKTRGLIDKTEFSLMKSSSFLINIARGPIVNHRALIYALKNGIIAGAGLDVFDQEPIPMNDPLLKTDNLILTPHMGPNTIECRRRMAMTAAEEILRVLHKEKPRYVVNQEVIK